MEKEPNVALMHNVFDMRLKELHFYAAEMFFRHFSSLGISRWKDMKQINGCGEESQPILIWFIGIIIA